ncbi:MAG: histidinol-phosphate transaminase [Actinomycetota bacterium]|nr:histidinol-phosphate transaminase [Actinomycetota bacterium]
MTSAPRLRPLLQQLPGYKPGRRPAPGTTPARLASNETPHPPLPSVVRAVAAALDAGNRYPDPTCAELTAALAERYGLPGAQVAVGCGSVSLVQQLVQITADAGEEVLYAWRSFEAYPGFVRVAGAVPVEVPLRGAEHDLHAMADAITPRTRLVLLCTPNNPTGPALAESDVRAFLGRVPDDVLVVLDEAYAEFVTDPAAVDGTRLLAEHPNLAVLRTFSKAYGLAGLRVGYCLSGSAEVAAALRRVQVPFSVSLPAQVAALASLQAADELADRVAAVVAEREPLRKALRELGSDVPPAQGNFVWLPAGSDSDRLTAVFEDAGVLVRCFSGEGIRVTVTTAQDSERVLAAVRAAQEGAAQGG